MPCDACVYVQMCLCTAVNVHLELCNSRLLLFYDMILRLCKPVCGASLAPISLASASGTAKRSRPQNNGVDSPAVAETSKRQKGSCGLERVVSMSTVLRCVDTRADKEGSFDAAVGQRPATVHEVTEGTTFHVEGGKSACHSATSVWLSHLQSE